MLALEACKIINHFSTPDMQLIEVQIANGVKRVMFTFEDCKDQWT